MTITIQNKDTKEIKSFIGDTHLDIYMAIYDYTFDNQWDNFVVLNH